MKAPGLDIDGNDPESDNSGSGQPFVRQVEDHSLPAAEVLLLQKDVQRPESPTQIFVP